MSNKHFADGQGHGLPRAFDRQALERFLYLPEDDLGSKSEAAAVALHLLLGALATEVDFEAHPMRLAVATAVEKVKLSL